jgi:hypothetical protein
MEERVVPSVHRLSALRHRPSLDERAALIARWKVMTRI